MSPDNRKLIQEIEELSVILKPWMDQIVLGGGIALILYDTILSKANAGAVGTLDIDFLIPRKPVKPLSPSIARLLVDHDYEPKNKSLDNPSVQSFVKELDDIEFEIEFLTDNKSRKKEEVVVIKEAGIHAQPLSYLEMSLQEATPLHLPNGEEILVAKPEAWVFHKGLTFPKRENRLKKLKDLYGIWFVLSRMNEVSAATRLALQKLMKTQPANWAKTYKTNLRNWIKEASPRDWDDLALQDVTGNLTQRDFIALVSPD